ncbi:MAG: decarboxylating 6-phosphogluconate dehydrogenase [Xanthomonadales bacterium]|jgi:6-phosphogluconate dehydrogenase|nr:decarboxylating 6-phosphogluconate dehydrogenase [Xanthomonadales bacterium]
MHLGMVGLGKMGGNMVRRLRSKGIDIVAYDIDAAQTRALGEETGATAVESLEALVQALPAPRTVWLMLPAGAITQGAVDRLAELLETGDRIVDGANSRYRDALHRSEALAGAGIHFVDAGVSGGIWGLEAGYCLMLGGDKSDIDAIRPVIEALAPAADRGWVHCGPVGSGHYAKMVHNGIEYGMMQALAEGLALMKSREDFDYDLAALTEAWRHGSVVRSWLLDLTAGFLGEDQDLDAIAPVVPDSGEGRWTAIEAIDQGVPAPVMTQAIIARFESQGGGDYTARLLASMRNAFGGHAVLPSDQA